MPTVKLYLNDDEHEYVKKMPAGYVRILVQRDMTPTEAKKTPKGVDAFKCSECGQIKCAGKCINKSCKKYGK